MTYVAASLVLVASILGIVLTVLTLPGVWLAVIVAAGCALWQPGLLSWWTVGIAAGLALLGEIIDTGASAVGAARTGGGKSGAIGSVVGGIAGAIVGSMIVPIIGTILGAIIGAGLGAVAAERGISEKSWRQSMNVGAGAAAGRAVAMVAKIGISIAAGLLLSVAVFAP